MRRWPLVAAAGLVLGACATWSPVTTEYHAADGSYEMKCTVSLSRCLDHADQVCHGGGYQVLRASDDREYRGPEVGQSETRSSRAVIRCAPRGRPLFGGGGGGEQAAASPDAGVPSPARACVPGSTQICFGPAACRGGQSCLADGSGFSPCACAVGGDGGASPAAPDAAGPPAP